MSHFSTGWSVVGDGSPAKLLTTVLCIVAICRHKLANSDCLVRDAGLHLEVTQLKRGYICLSTPPKTTSSIPYTNNTITKSGQVTTLPRYK